MLIILTAKALKKVFLHDRSSFSDMDPDVFLKSEPKSIIIARCELQQPFLIIKLLLTK